MSFFFLHKIRLPRMILGFNFLKNKNLLLVIFKKIILLSCRGSIQRLHKKFIVGKFLGKVSKNTRFFYHLFISFIPFYLFTWLIFCCVIYSSIFNPTPPLACPSFTLHFIFISLLLHLREEKKIVFLFFFFQSFLWILGSMTSSRARGNDETDTTIATMQVTNLTVVHALGFTIVIIRFFIFIFFAGGIICLYIYMCTVSCAIVEFKKTQ